MWSGSYPQLDGDNIFGMKIPLFPHFLFDIREVFQFYSP
jgi:hypothetical protein